MIIDFKNKKDLKTIKQILTVLLLLNILAIAVTVIAGLYITHRQHQIQQDFDDYLENQQETEWINSLPPDFED